MSRRCAFLLVVLSALASTPAIDGEVELPALGPAVGGGLEVVDRSLARLAGHRRLLVVGAHPDDEDNALLSYVGRGLGGEVAYLSLSRGEGGQNLIGPELGVELGVIRTGELLAARRVEDTRQYFASARDFGYTRSLEETLARWPREVLRRDALRVARRFKPQVVVSVFPESSRAGHGQHQAAAVIARDVFELAGDGAAAPELGDEGLEPWAPRALYRRAWGAQEATLAYSLGSLDPLSGRSLAQIAAASRSLHRSQDMGREQRIGRYPGGLVWLAGGAGAEGGHLFAGVDTRLAAIASSLEDAAERSRLEQELIAVEAKAMEIRRELTPVALGDVVGSLADLVRALRRAEEMARAATSRSVAELVSEKRGIAERALLAAAGVVVDAVADRETLPLGGEATVELALWSAGESNVEVRGAAVVSPAAWQVDETEALGRDEETEVRLWRTRVRVPSDADPTRPYFLDRPLSGDLYDWSATPVEVRGEPFQAPPLTAVFDLEVAGVPLRVRREVVHRWADQAVGEIRRPLRAVPPIEVSLGEPLHLWLRGRDQRAELEVVVRSNSESPVSGRVEMALPKDWAVLGDPSFRIEAQGSTVRRLELLASGTPPRGRMSLAVSAQISGGGSVDGSYPLVEYPHIAPVVVPRAAALELSIFDLELPDVDRVGYVRGASDRVPDILRAVGVPLTVLSSEILSVGDLDAYDVIVVGSRAYETDIALRRSNGRLLEYVRRGGVLIVQYQQYQFVDGAFAPYALEIDRPHGRVTDETAAIDVLVADHPVFLQPNAIEPQDWEGWVQERGLYFAGRWDPAYLSLLATADAGRAAERGALLVARHGDGTYVYTGLSFFRQLPAGVPGAIRLFCNLLALRETG